MAAVKSSELGVPTEIASSSSSFRPGCTIISFIRLLKALVWAFEAVTSKRTLYAWENARHFA